MNALVTGAAGFVGSTLVDELLQRGHTVRGVDCFTRYYDPAIKRLNVSKARAYRTFEFVEADLRTADLRPLFDEVEVVFHQAAQPGVRLSWAHGFVEYDSCNVLATQRLLEICRLVPIERFVFASSSSVYGNAPAYPTHEGVIPRPHSPYGVTKLAAEHLCTLYAVNWRVPTISLRYFTVYGPRQRPDMAINRLFAAGLGGHRFPIYGDGTQLRDFTFVGDVVSANLAASVENLEPGTVFNIAGGSSISVRDLIQVASQVLGRAIEVEYQAAQPGDVRQTGGTIDAARDLLDWYPKVGLSDGLAAQARWQETATADFQ